MTDFDLDQFLPYRLSLLANRTRLGFAQHYESKYGLSNPEWRVLAHVSQVPQISVRDIQHRTELEKSKVSRAVSRLEQRGYLAKKTDSRDNRLLVLSLTPHGKRLMHKLKAAAAAYQQAVLADLSDAEQRDIDTSLKLLDAALS